MLYALILSASAATSPCSGSFTDDGTPIVFVPAYESTGVYADPATREPSYAVVPTEDVGIAYIEGGPTHVLALTPDTAAAHPPEPPEELFECAPEEEVEGRGLPWGGIAAVGLTWVTMFLLWGT